MSTRPPGEAYRESGVDLFRMDELKERIRGLAASTHGPEVIDDAGSFAGLFRLGGDDGPVLAASADGVGTKLKIAAQLGHFESIGQDLVTLNVNDILTRGARPLFFLDYVAFSDVDAQSLDALMRGIAWGCREVGCALIGGETAQMPQVYANGEMDLAGFVVGVVEPDRLLGPGKVNEGDVLLGIPSSGLHTNGFSLVRKVFNTDSDPSALYRRFDGLKHQLGEELLLRHRCYYPMLAPALGAGQRLGPHHRRGPARKTPGGPAGRLGGRDNPRFLGSAADFRPVATRGRTGRRGDVPRVQHGTGHGGRLPRTKRRGCPGGRGRRRARGPSRQTRSRRPGSVHRVTISGPCQSGITARRSGEDI